MRLLFELIKKEAFILLRDKLHLIGLFLMPSCFVIILSVALNDAFNEKRGFGLKAGFLDYDEGELSSVLLNEIKTSQNIDFQFFNNIDIEEALKISKLKKYSFLLVIPKDFSSNISNYIQEYDTKEKSIKLPSVKIYYDALLNINIRNAVYLNIKNKIHSYITNLFYELLKDSNKDDIFIENEATEENLDLSIEVQKLSLSELNKDFIPSASQQNVPAWSVFAMFFIIIPLASNLCSERQELTFLRLKTMPASFIFVLFGKLIPYIVINLLQLFIMILLGIYLVPVLGGEKLIIGNSYFGIFLIGVFSSVFATTFGLLVSSLCRTYNQVAAFAPPLIVILASIGGIIVPKIIMPNFMQKIASLSPFDWILNGFFELYLLGGNYITIWPVLFKLFLFSLLFFFSSYVKLKNEN